MARARAHHLGGMPTLGCTLFGDVCSDVVELFIHSKGCYHVLFHMGVEASVIWLDAWCHKIR